MHPLVQQTSLTQHAAWVEKSLHRLAGVGAYVLSGRCTFRLVGAQLESRRARAMASAVTSAAWWSLYAREESGNPQNWSFANKAVDM